MWVCPWYHTLWILIDIHIYIILVARGEAQSNTQEPHTNGQYKASLELNQTLCDSNIGKVEPAMCFQDTCTLLSLAQHHLLIAATVVSEETESIKAKPLREGVQHRSCFLRWETCSPSLFSAQLCRKLMPFKTFGGRVVFSLNSGLSLQHSSMKRPLRLGPLVYESGGHRLS